MAEPLYPSLYQINTRVWLTELCTGLGRAATLGDVPDAALDRIAAMGFDWVWLLSVWRTGAAGQRISRCNLEWRKEFEDTLPDLREEDIAGSGFAITKASIAADGKPICEAEITFRVMPFPEKSMRRAMEETAARIGFPMQALADG